MSKQTLLFNRRRVQKLLQANTERGEKGEGNVLNNEAPYSVNSFPAFPL